MEVDPPDGSKAFGEEAKQHTANGFKHESGQSVSDGGSGDTDEDHDFSNGDVDGHHDDSNGDAFEDHDDSSGDVGELHDDSSSDDKHSRVVSANRASRQGIRAARWIMHPLLMVYCIAGSCDLIDLVSYGQ